MCDIDLNNFKHHRNPAYIYTESLLWKIIVKREDTGLKRQGHAVPAYFYVLRNALVLARNARRRQITLSQAHISLIFDSTRQDRMFKVNSAIFLLLCLVASPHVNGKVSLFEVINLTILQAVSK